MLQATSMPKIKLDKRLNLTHGEKLCWKLRINRVVKQRGGNSVNYERRYSYSS